MNSATDPRRITKALRRVTLSTRTALVLLVTASGTLATSAAADAMFWTGGAERAMGQEWASAATGDACNVTPSDGLTSRIQRVRSPVVQGRYAYRFEVQDGDNCYGPRAELADASSNRLMRAGQERWISMQAYFPNNYQLDAPANYRTGLMQLKQIGTYGQYPAITVSNGSGYLCIYLDSTATFSNQHCGWGYYDLGRPAKNAWVQLTFHILFEGDNTGFVEVYGNLHDGQGYRQLISLPHVQTLMDDGSTPLPSLVRLGIYRSPMVHGTEDLDVDGFTVATDRASAEANAFGRARARFALACRPLRPHRRHHRHHRHHKRPTARRHRRVRHRAACAGRRARAAAHR
jgi:Polysaccharide lyase